MRDSRSDRRREADRADVVLGQGCADAEKEVPRNAAVAKHRMGKEGIAEKGDFARAGELGNIFVDKIEISSNKRSNRLKPLAQIDARRLGAVSRAARTKNEGGGRKRFDENVRVDGVRASGWRSVFRRQFGR
jgi:hypothetical protein